MIIIGGTRYALAGGVKSVSYGENPTLAPRITDYNRRTRAIRSIIVHTTSGGSSKGVVLPGDMPGDDKRGALLARYQTRTERRVSWDYTIDRDGTVFCQNDPLEFCSWHAEGWNPLSVGIELVQNADGSLYEAQMTALVALIDLVTLKVGIQRQLHRCAADASADGKVSKRSLTLLTRADTSGSLRGANMVGVFAHCHNTKDRGPGDPGPAPFNALLAAGYEGFDFERGEDLAVWRERQAEIGADVDGIPLTNTVMHLQRQPEHRRGLWVKRPSDGIDSGILR